MAGEVVRVDAGRYIVMGLTGRRMIMRSRERGTNRIMG